MVDDQRKAIKILICHASEDSRLASALSEELNCLDWQPHSMESGNLPIRSDWKISVKSLIEQQDAFCFLVSASFEKSAACLQELEEVRNQRNEAPRFVILVNINRSRCVESEIPMHIKEGLGGVSRLDIIKLAGQIDLTGRGKATQQLPIKARRGIIFRPSPIESLLSQGDCKVRRQSVEAALVERLRYNRVVAVYGLPSSGRSSLVVDALGHVQEHEPDHSRWPFFIIATRDTSGSMPDLRRLCSIVFDLLGPPPATADDDPATALVALLDSCETWLFLDQFETIATSDGQCNDPDLARFLRLSDETLERGRIILTAATPGILMEAGHRCASFHLPDWTDSELNWLVKHIAQSLGSNLPHEPALERIRQWASGNPYLLMLALREWYATGATPRVKLANVVPFQSLGSFEQTLSPTKRVILFALLLLSTFPVSEKLVIRVINQASVLASPTNSKFSINVQEELQQLAASGILELHLLENQSYYRLPGIVIAYFKDACVKYENLLKKLGETIAKSILLEEHNEDFSSTIFGPAVHDGRTWLWPALPTNEVTRSIRAADVLVHAELPDHVVNLLTNNREVLKWFNRLAPASVRRIFFSRISQMAGIDSLSTHEASRGWALALADIAEFQAAIDVLDTAAEALIKVRDVEIATKSRILKAKNNDLKAYCLRQLERYEESIYTYQLALEMLDRRIDRDELCKLLRGMANSYVAEGNLTAAHAFFKDARRVAKRLRQDRRLFNLGRINCDQSLMAVRMGRADEAKSYCLESIGALRASGDYWNERIASLNLCGIELALDGNLDQQRSALQSIIPALVQLESIVALRAARLNMDWLNSNTTVVNALNSWLFVELT